MSLIVTRELSKNFGRNTALDRVSLEVSTGPPTALVGPNGAGKTTLMSLVSGFIRPDHGTITILDRPPGHPELLGRVSALPQDAQLDPNLAVGDQLTFFARLLGYSVREAKAETERVLELVQLREAANHLASTLSHGMSKRIAIAQALLGEPTLVLLDEPTAGLDPASARHVRDVISQTSHDTCFLISSHNLEEIERLCDWVFYLDSGRLSQTLSIRQTTSAKFITLGLAMAAASNFTAELASLPSVTNVTSQQGDKVFILTYTAGTQPHALESAILALLAQLDMNYRFLINGKTLEDKLFS